MLRFKHFLIEKLTSDQEREVSTWERDPEAIKHTDHYFGVGNDEINEPLSGGHSEKSEPHKAVERHLGREIDVDSYKKGLTKDKYGRDVKIGSLLSKSKAPQKLVNDFANDNTRQLKKAEGLTVRITRSPAGVAGQTSRGQSWENQSCKNYETGSNNFYLEHEVKHGTVVAYLMHPNGTELARATLHPHYNNSGHVAYDINSYYGVDHEEFRNHVHNLATKLSGEHKGGSILYHIHPYVYNDKNSEKILHPTTSSETIDGLLNHQDSDIRSDVASSRLLSPAQISKALQDKEVGVRSAAIQNENANADHITKALDDTVEQVRAHAILHPKANADHITKALNDTYAGVRSYALMHKKVNAGHITKALNDESYSVRQMAIKHPNATVEHITKALQDSHGVVREYAIQHPKVTTDHITQALNDQDPYIRKLAISHPKANEDHIEQALSDNNVDIRQKAISHLNATPHHIGIALSDEAQEVRVKAIQNWNANDSNISQALNSDDPYVRYAAIQHPKATIDHLKYAVDNDSEDPRIKDAARNVLRTKHNIFY